MAVSRGGNNRLNEKPRDPWLRRKWEGQYGAGKGDGRRRLDESKFRENYDKVFGHCNDHLDYKAEAPPTADCIVCRRLWREAQLKRASESPPKEGG